MLLARQARECWSGSWRMGKKFYRYRYILVVLGRSLENDRRRSRTAVIHKTCSCACAEMVTRVCVPLLIGEGPSSIQWWTRPPARRKSAIPYNNSFFFLSKNNSFFYFELWGVRKNNLIKYANNKPIWPWNKSHGISGICLEIVWWNRSGTQGYNWLAIVIAKCSAAAAWLVHPIHAAVLGRSLIAALIIHREVLLVLVLARVVTQIFV